MQPACRFPNFKSFFFGEDAMGERPRIAVRVAQCIARWAEIESMLGQFLATIHTDSNTIFAIYNSVENRAAQMRMLTAAAQAKLSSEHFDVFSVLMSAHVRPVMKERDKLAHWCWGLSWELPEAALITPPSAAMIAHFTVVCSKGEPFRIEEKDIYVVTEKDLIRRVEASLNARELLRLFIDSLWETNTPERRAASLLSISNESQIREGLERLRANRKGTQKSPSPPPQEARSG